MSNTQEHTTAHEHEHESVPIIKTPKQLIITVIFAFIIPIIVLIMLANMVTFGNKPNAGSNAFTAEAIDKRIAPIAGFALIDANAPKVFKTGEQVFSAVCTSCHQAGVAGAPKVGDHAAWQPLIKTGLETMVKVAIAGKGAMPPKGGNPSLSDYEITRAIVYMTNQSGASFQEPAAPEKPTANAEPNKVDPQTLSSAKPEPSSDKTSPASSTSNTSSTPASTAPGKSSAEQTDSSANNSVAQASPPPTINPAGEKLYQSVCIACHAAGVAGAPKYGDKLAWAPHVKKGLDEMVKVVLAGKGAMPPKGGAVNASEADIRAALQFMVNATN